MRQFSIRTLMVVIVVSAVGLVAARHVHYWWPGVLLLMAAAAAEIAILGAILLRRFQRVWWVGFALCTGGYLVLTLDPWLSANLGTTYVLHFAHAKLAPADLEHDAGFYEMRNLPLPVDNRWQPLVGETVTFEAFERVGHALVALLVGLVGGVVIVWFYARRQRSEAVPG
jgi:hypothetical protein